MGDRLWAGNTISVCNKPTRSTQPCIPPGSLNRVPASAGVRAGISPQPGGRSLCDPIWHVSSGSGVATLRTAVHLLLYIFTFLPLPVSSFIYSYFITYSASCNQVVVCQPLLKSHLIWSVTGSTRCRPVRFVHCGYFQFSFRTGVQFTSVNVRWTSPE